jgi:hypothetical protein
MSHSPSSSTLRLSIAAIVTAIDLGAQTQYGNSGFVCTANGTVPVD